jgi:predicted MFS family arabinose efflux permease
VFSIKQTGVPLGGIIAGSLTPLLALALGWQGAVLAVGPAALALAVAIEPGRRHRDGPRPARLPRSRRGQDGGMAHVLGDPGLRNLCAMAFLFAATQLSLAGFVVAFGVVELGFSPIAAGLLLSLVQFSGGSARLLLGWIADRLQANAQVLAATGGFAALGGIGFFVIGLTGQATPAWIVYTLAILFGIGAVGWNGIFLAEIANRAPPDLVGAITGAANVITFAGVVFGPIIFVALHGVFDSYAAAFLAMALPAGLGSVLVARIRCR